MRLIYYSIDGSCRHNEVIEMIKEENKKLLQVEAKYDRMYKSIMDQREKMENLVERIKAMKIEIQEKEKEIYTQALEERKSLMKIIISLKDKLSKASANESSLEEEVSNHISMREGI